MSRSTRPFAVRLYAAALRCLPAEVWKADGDEMTRAFAELCGEAHGRHRLRLAARLFSRLPAVIVLEWMDVLGWTAEKGERVMTGWGRHVRYALRTLRNAPTFTAATVLLIGLGVGAFTTVFTVVDHVLIRPLPYPAAERLVTVENGSHSGLVFQAFKEVDGVEAWVAGRVRDANLLGDGEPVRIEVASVSEGFFAFFGARPAQGRLLVDADHAAADAVVVSNTAWRELFGGDPSILGRTLRIDGAPVVVVGVLDEAFEPPQHIASQRTTLYEPIDWSDERFSDAGYHMLEVAGRVSPGADLALIQERLDATAQRMAAAHDEARSRDGEPEPLPLVGLQDATVQTVRSGLNLLMGAVGLLLLVACLNVAHLVLARSLSRAQEMAVRRALGAGSSGLLKQLFAESLLVGLAGGFVGMVLAALGVAGLMSVSPYAVPRADAVAVDMRVVAFATMVSVATAVVFGLVPALRSMTVDVHGQLKGRGRGSTGGRGTQRFRNGLVVAEVALSLVLVAQAGLLLRSFAQARAPNPGFDPQGVWTIPLTPTGIDDAQEYVRRMDAVLASLQALPGVEAASYGLTQPFQYTGRSRCCWTQGGVEVDGEVVESLRMLTHPVSADYFETLALPMVAGRVWLAAEEDARPVPGVVTERLAIDLFGSAEAAVGRVIGAPDRLQLHVVGVAADAKHYGLDQPDQQGAYVPVSALPFSIPLSHMAVRIRGTAPEGFARTLREAVWRAAPDLPVPVVRPMTEWMSASMSQRRFDSYVFGSFGVLALLLAAAGLYGTLLYGVRQRRRELGIRMALGAARLRLEREVVVRGLRLTAMGAAVGVVGSVWVGGLLESRLFEVQGGDPVALGAATATLIITAALASWVPARRAGRTDPLEALSAE